MRPETVIMAAAIFMILWRLRPRRHRHSFIYRHYIDNQSRLWRFRRWLWFWTSNHRCEKCHTRVKLHSSNPRRRATFDHKNYDHLLFERRGRDIRMLCWPCHHAKDAWRHR
jgi:hypothetical protein